MPLAKEDLGHFVDTLQEVLVGALRAGADKSWDTSSWPSETERALEMVAVTIKGFRTKLCVLVDKAATQDKSLTPERDEEPGAFDKDYVSLKTELCEELRSRLLRCSSSDKSEEWRRAVDRLLMQAQDAVMVKQMARSSNAARTRPVEFLPPAHEVAPRHLP